MGQPRSLRSGVPLALLGDLICSENPMNLSTSRATTRHKANMSTAKINAAEQQSSRMVFRHSDGTYRQADRHELMSDNDWDIIHSYNRHREHMRDLAERKEYGNSSTYFHLQAKIGATTVYADFYVNHSTDNVTVKLYTTSSHDTIRTYSVDAARRLYSTLIRRGYKLQS